MKIIIEIANCKKYNYQQTIVVPDVGSISKEQIQTDWLRGRILSWKRGGIYVGMNRKKRNIVFSLFLICAVFMVSCAPKVSETDSNNETIYEGVTEELESDPESTASEAFTNETKESDKENIPNEFMVEEEQEVWTEMETHEKNAEDILAEMSLAEKVYQMFIITPEQLTGAETVTAAGDMTKNSLQEYPVGGLIYFAPNLINSNQTSEMLEKSQEFALETEGLPLFLCVDEEGGRVARVANIPAFGLEKIKPMKEVESTEEAYEIGHTIGRYLSKLGFNVDFAPDADVLTNSENTVIGDRSFGDDPEVVTDYASAYSDGLHSCGVLSTFKHFPGHGSSAGDTHQGFAYTDKTLEDLEQNELVPFMAAQDENVDMVMVAHIAVPEILGNDTPCTLSQYMVTDVLRERLRYEGLVVTDAMNMEAITSVYDNNQAVVEAVKAGSDLILMPVDFKAAANAVVSAVESGEISIESIDESVKRIIVKKLWLMKENS